MSARPGIRLTLVLLMLTLAVGCSEPVRVTVPPLAPVAGIETIAVLEFGNATIDPGMGVEFTAAVVDAIRESGAYSVIEPTVAAALLAKHGITPTQAADPAIAVQIGSMLNCDAIVTGEITHYLEDVSVDMPYRVGSTAEGKTPTWYSGLTTSVHITARARVIETKTGSIIWSKRVSEGDAGGLSIELTWGYNDPPPVSLLPKPNRSQVPAVRDSAIRRVVAAFTADILPSYRYEWRKVEPEQTSAVD